MHVLEMNVAHPSPIRHIIVATIATIGAWQFRGLLSTTWIHPTMQHGRELEVRVDVLFIALEVTAHGLPPTYII